MSTSWNNHSCDRNGCKNVAFKEIMGGEVRLCQGCWEELLAEKDRWDNHMLRHEVRTKIMAFVHTWKGSTEIVDTKKEFERLTRDVRKQ